MIKNYTLPESLGGHTVQPVKARCQDQYPGYQEVLVPGMTLPVLVPGEKLKAALPPEPPWGSLVACKNRPGGRSGWSYYHRYGLGVATHAWGCASTRENETYSWERINKDHDEVILLVRGGTICEIVVRGRSEYGTNYCLERDNDQRFAVLEVGVGRAVLTDDALLEMAQAILNDRFGTGSGRGPS